MRFQYVEVFPETAVGLECDDHEARRHRVVHRQAAEQHEGRNDEEPPAHADEPRDDADDETITSTAAVEALEAWLRATDRSSPEAHWLLASAYLLQDRLEAGVAQIAKGRAAKAEPPEAVQRLLLAALLRSGRQAEAAALLRQLLERAPGRADDWRRLAALQRDLGADDQALAILETLYARGWMTHESELLALAHLQLELGVPYRAARLLEDALQRGQIAASEDTWLLIIHAWQRAREIAQAVQVRAQGAKFRNERGERSTVALQGGFEFKALPDRHNATSRSSRPPRRRREPLPMTGERLRGNPHPGPRRRWLTASRPPGSFCRTAARQRPSPAPPRNRWRSGSAPACPGNRAEYKLPG